MIRILLIWWLCVTGIAAQAQTVRVAVTTSFENSGLADVLLPAILADTGVEVQLIVVGTGQALRLGAAGDVDAVIVHAEAAEIEFVQDGYASHRRPFMYNDFVLIGPAADPALVQSGNDVLDAVQSIAETQARFVSRGDDSGTHKAELQLWAAAGLEVSDFGNWYTAVGAGMGAALNTASAMGAYVLSDRGSWLNFGNPGGLALLFEGDDRLANQYSFLPINAALHPHVAADAVRDVEHWLTGKAAQILIDGYRIKGQQLFNFNAVAQ